MIDRRKLLGMVLGAMTAGCCLCCRGATAKPRLIGCVWADGGFNPGDVDQWAPHHPDRMVELDFDVKASDFGFAINPAMAFYPDGNDLNAFATTTEWQRGRRDGTVVIGMNMARKLTAAPGRYISTIVVAHEMGHILQFKRGLRTPGVQMETHADFMAGWGYAQFQKNHFRRYGEIFDIETMADAMFSAGDTLFDQPFHHGEPHYRATMVRAGYDAQDLDLNAAFAKGLRLVGLG